MGTGQEIREYTKGSAQKFSILTVQVEYLNFELFRAYVDLPASLPHKYDVIIDDGRARVPCAQSALRYHGLINYVDTKAKCPHMKVLTCKGTLRQVL